MAYNRYTKLIRNGSIKKVPKIDIPFKSSDMYVTYKKGFTRLDNVSFDIYGDPNYDWLILMANNDVASLEFEIPDGYDIRVPYPLQQTLEEYNKRIDYYDSLYTID
jgi:nucleoid-associated protein YgaU